MKTTITEYKKAVCSRCGGRGFLPQFQHRNGGECFACGATGDGPLTAYEREMTDDEVLIALENAGFPVVLKEKEPTGDWLADLFMAPDEQAEYDAALIGARKLLAEL